MHLLDNPIRSDQLLEKTFDIDHRFYASSSEPLDLQELINWTIENGDQELVDLMHDHSLGYADNGGSQDIRAEIATLYDDSITEDNIVIFPGAQTGMTLTALAMIHDGDHAIVVTPSYQSLEEGIKYAGGDVTRIGLTPEDNWQVNVDAVKAAIRSNTKYLVFNDPHNPSGSLMKPEIKSELVKLAEEHGFHVFSDEVYRLLEINPDDRSASVAEMTKNGLALGTMAKPWGAGGCCVGWVACQDIDVIRKLQKAQHLFAVCVSRTGEIQARMVIRASDKIIERNMNIINENLVLLDQFFDEYSDLFEWMRPEASGTGFVKFKGPMTSNELAEELLEVGILVFPSYIFDCDESQKQYFRIGFSRKTMPAALDAFKTFVDERKESWKS
ncbi:aminotransferase class I/II-fold pyridoxal phosphate-dependent enzyme [Pseudemcibacter aquimaris]|uniref:aminotransferase class I/II-fold pyridoxal phosphate-dependent enzyme n=1 Tax=Pseudemcibacter aquimaris TaxID=2857064 RepID=UPI0020111DD4|nr:aminotransferase class I/II-fold pyridoxal phosphate-dependent enzyme [Pseudemcibacter aquimaris]MCC3861230.1 aminotransferase class I/II-fold pyridoxal phosphate-dependent enzyme [Pseudemcibacter aquimaris]WDU58005.1 aminotransferase class I/II-fold pyridoxal phosphate-dependent enzyme [Pseudemcibacter aquimaris]